MATVPRKDVLKEKGITQQMLADKMDVSLSAVKQMVNANSLTTTTLEKIAAALEIPIWQLFVSPNDIIGANEELTAIIQHKGNFYKATTMAELEKIVYKIKEKV